MERANPIRFKIAITIAHQYRESDKQKRRMGPLYHGP